MPSIDTFPTISPFDGIPYLGTIFEQRLLTYIAFALIPMVAWIIYRTRFGLNIRAVGENPEAADAAGLNVYWIRTSRTNDRRCVDGCRWCIPFRSHAGCHVVWHHFRTRLGLHCPDYFCQLETGRCVLGITYCSEVSSPCNWPYRRPGSSFLMSYC